MPFSDFIGNQPAVSHLRRLIAADNMNRTLLLTGPKGIGKMTLAVMAGLAINCQAPAQKGDFCDRCASCAALAPAWSDLAGLAAAAMTFREEQVKTRAKELAPLIVPLHPQIVAFPADGDFLSIHQARALTQRAQLRPDPGRHWVFILPEFDRTRWLVQNSLLKVLEEPPAGVVILALAENPLELLPTIRSRALALALAPIDDTLLVGLAARRPLDPAAQALLVRLARGCPGRALTLDLAAYRLLRRQALDLLAAARGGDSLDAIFALTERWRSGKEKLESLLEILYSLLQDILYLISGHPEAIRNQDCRPEVAGLAQAFTVDKLTRAVMETDRIFSASRRNVNRSLALDAWALRLAGSATGGE